MSGLPALDINPALYGAQTSLATTQAQSALAQYNMLQQTMPGAIAAENARNQAASTLAPLSVQEGTQQNSLSQIDFSGKAIADLVKRVSTLDPDQRAAAWDAGFKQLAEEGVGTASQYIGHYRQDLADRLGSAYGGQTPNAPSGFDPEATARAISQMPPQDRSKGLKNFTLAVTGYDKVRDEDSWNQEIATLRQAGLPVDDVLTPGANWQMNYMSVRPLIDRFRATIPIMQSAVAGDTMGLPVAASAAPVKLSAGESLVDSVTGRPIVTAPGQNPYEFVGTDRTMGAPGTFNKATGAFNPVPGTDQYGGPQGNPIGAFADRMMQAENGTGNPGAKNPNSTATGNGQFINSTWLDMMKSVHPDMAKSMTPEQQLALRTDPGFAKEMTEQYAQRNAAALSTEGLPVTTASLALAHRFGPDGATKLLQASPETPLSSIFPKKVIDANPGLARVTAGQYVQGIVQQFGNVPLQGGPQGTVGPDVHGQDYLASLPPSMSALVRSYAEGRQAFPSGFALKSPYFQNMLRMVAQYDPNFDAVNFNARAGTRRDFTSGKSAQTINALNTGLGHLAMLDQAGDALQNGDIPAWNYVRNNIASATGQPAPGNFNAAAGLVAEELTRIYRGSGGAEADIKRHLDDLSVNASPAQRRGALYAIGELLKSKLDAMGEQYNQGMGTTQDPLRLLNAPAQQSFRRILAYGPSGTGTPPSAPASSAAPSRPGNLPAGSQYSPSRRMWRDPQGKLYKADGTPAS